MTKHKVSLPNMPMTTHLAQIILFYPGKDSTLGTDPFPAIVIAAHSQEGVNLELLTGAERGLQFSSVPYEAVPENREGFCWHLKEVLDIFGGTAT